MPLKPLLDLILRDQFLTHRLEDAEARMLIDWLIARAEAEHANDPSKERVKRKIMRLCRRARAIARFVTLWCHDRLAGPALQLAATERFAFPLPVHHGDASDLLHDILTWEDQPASADRQGVLP